MKVKTSELDNETVVLLVEEGDDGPVVDRLETQPNGFAIMSQDVGFPISMAVVDTRRLNEDWFTENHLLAIEAHELGHIRMNSSDEVEAEKEGIRLLQKNNLHEAADILVSRGIV